MSDVVPNQQTESYIVWENYGYEGWQPKYYATLPEALTTPRFVTEWIITKAVSFQVCEDGKVLVGA